MIFSRLKTTTSSFSECRFIPLLASPYNEIVNLPTPTKEGYTFNKWDNDITQIVKDNLVFNAIYDNLLKRGFKIFIPREINAGLVCSAIYPEDKNWDFTKIHDYCYERGFTIYPGKVEKKGMFRLCALGAIDEGDVMEFFKVFDENQLEYILLARGAGDDVYMVGKVVVFQIQNLLVAYKERFDKDNFIKNLLLDNLLLVDIYNRAKKLHIDADVRRVVMILEMEQEKDHGAMESVKSFFGLSPLRL